jgi:hypothetical protein
VERPGQPARLPFTLPWDAIPRGIDALRQPTAVEEDPGMSETRQQFSASLAKDAVCTVVVEAMPAPAAAP